MCQHTQTVIRTVLIGLCLLRPSEGYGMTKAELQEHLRDHMNERMYGTCKQVVLTEEGDNVYRGYVEYINGVRDAIDVKVSGDVVEYAPAASPEQHTLSTDLQTLQAEIARLRTLCRQAGVDPDRSDTPVARTDDTSVLRRESMPFTNRMYDEIRKGMAYPKVAEMLGAKGNCIASSRSDGGTNEIWVWVNPDDSHICLVFQNGRVLVKAQADLIETGLLPEPAASGQD